MCGALKNITIISKKTIDSITLSIMAVGKFSMTLFLFVNDALMVLSILDGMSFTM
jgi:hypothetical protein